MSTRTSIRFGPILEALAAEKLKKYQPFLNEAVSHSLLYGYRCQMAGHYYGFILIQAARTSGRVTAEVAVSRTPDYPYYRLGDTPRLGVSGYRERVLKLTRKADSSFSYRGQEQLLGVLLDLLRESEMALGRLSDQVIPLIIEDYKQWQPLYRDWLEAEKNAIEGDIRYPELGGEMVARELLGDTLARGTFDRFLGPLKFRYRKPDFFLCHLYLMARALEFLEPPKMAAGGAEPAEESPEVLPDPIPALTGRQPQDEAVELAVSTSLRTAQWAFLKSFAAVEAFFTDESTADPAWLREIEAKPAATNFSGIMEDPIYNSPQPVTPPVAPAPPRAVPPPPPPSQPPTVPGPKQGGRPDPFDRLSDFVKDDPFDVLGEAFGL